MADNNQFGKNLRRIRKEKGMTQDQLAKILRMQANAISRYEQGEVVPGISMVDRLAGALGVGIKDLVENK